MEPCHLLRSLVSTFAGLVVLLAMTGESYGQDGGRDYYAPRDTVVDRQFLENVEKYHLVPALQARGKNPLANFKADFEFVLNYYPNHPQALDLYSQLCTAKAPPPQCGADSRFRGALAINPNAAPTYIIYGIHLQRQGKPIEAVSQYRSALRFNPGSINAHYNIALALFELEKFQESNAHAQVAYAQGVPYPGLKDKLTRTGHWMPLDKNQIAQIFQNEGGGGASTKTGSDDPAASGK